VADPHGAKGVQWILGKTIFLCISIEFHHMCTPETMIFIYCGTIWLHGRLFSSSAAVDDEVSLDADCRYRIGAIQMVGFFI
jgi:hypothetical protein